MSDLIPFECGDYPVRVHVDEQGNFLQERVFF